MHTNMWENSSSQSLLFCFQWKAIWLSDKLKEKRKESLVHLRSCTWWIHRKICSTHMHWRAGWHFSERHTCTKCGRMVRMPDMKSYDPKFKYNLDHQLDLFQVVSGSTPWLCYVRSQLLCLLSVAILNMLGVFE